MRSWNEVPATRSYAFDDKSRSNTNRLEERMISARIQSALDKQSTRQGQQYYLQQPIQRWKERDLSVVHEQFVSVVHCIQVRAFI